MKRRRTLHVLAAALVALGLVLSGCGGNSDDRTDSQTSGVDTDQAADVSNAVDSVAQSSLERTADPEVDSASLEELVEGNSRFAFGLFAYLAEEDTNVFFSPYSISAALAMTYAGAREETASQMENVLGFSLGAAALHPAFNALDQRLMSPSRCLSNPDSDPFQLSIANALWGQVGHTFLEEYLDLLAVNYGAGIHRVDFENATEAARATINEWVSDQTEGKVPELLGAGMLSSSSRLVLTNAVYFNAAWSLPFEASDTVSAPFTLSDGSTIEVPMMNQITRFAYAKTEDVRVLELGYANSTMAMTILLPEPGALDSFIATLTAERFADLVAGLTSELIALRLPTFSYEASFLLADPLARMGMTTPFRGGVADFSGMDGTQELFIGEVVHKAFVAVDEAGTEAAAATAVIMVGTGAPMEQPTPIPFVVDRPFVFVIRDQETGTVLFIGKVMDPST